MSLKNDNKYIQQPCYNLKFVVNKYIIQSCAVALFTSRQCLEFVFLVADDGNQQQISTILQQIKLCKCFICHHHKAHWQALLGILVADGSNFLFLLNNFLLEDNCQNFILKILQYPFLTIQEQLWEHIVLQYIRPLQQGIQ